MRHHKVFLHLITHAPKSGIDVRIMRLKPVAKRPAQHASGCTRRTAFDDVVLSVEEIGRVARVKRERLESRKRCKDGGGPLPAVPHKAVNAEGTLPSRKRRY